MDGQSPSTGRGWVPGGREIANIRNAMTAQIVATPRLVVRGEARSRRPARTTGSRSSAHESSCHHGLVVMGRKARESGPQQIPGVSSAALILEVFRTTGPEVARTAPIRSAPARRGVSAYGACAM